MRFVVFYEGGHFYERTLESAFDHAAQWIRWKVSQNAPVDERWAVVRMIGGAARRFTEDDL